MGEKQVRTFSGRVASRDKCRYIKGEFYEEGVDCFKIGGKWNRINNGRIIFDHEINDVILKNNTKGLIEGVVAVQDNGELEFGFFTPNPTKNVEIIPPNQIPVIAISSDVLGKHYKESYGDRYFYHTASRNNTGIGVRDNYDELPYTSEKLWNTYSKIFEKYYKNPVNRKAFKLARYIPYTFGIEFETSNGYLRQQECYKHGLIPLMDGSLRKSGYTPYEYTTIPLGGHRGLDNIKQICNLLTRKCNVDHTCSLHIHLGGIKNDMITATALYKLFLSIQDDMFKMLPGYKVHWENFKNKNYCQPLDLKIGNIKKKGVSAAEYEELVRYEYAKIFKFVSCGHNLGEEVNRNTLRHPMNQQKWHINSRYYAFNFVPFIFSPQRTLEFRAHQGTLNVYKTINWLVIVAGLASYGEKFRYEILSGEKLPKTLVEIMSEVYPTRVSNYLNSYILDRQTYFGNLTAKKDYGALAELKADKTFTFGECLV